MYERFRVSIANQFTEHNLKKLSVSCYTNYVSVFMWDRSHLHHVDTINKFVRKQAKLNITGSIIVIGSNVIRLSNLFMHSVNSNVLTKGKI